MTLSDTQFNTLTETSFDMAVMYKFYKRMLPTYRRHGLTDKAAKAEAFISNIESCFDN